MTLAPLSVTSTAPSDGQEGVATNTKKVVAIFNKAVKSETVTEDSFTLQADGEPVMSGTVTYDTDTASAIFTLADSDLLQDKTDYKATISTVVEDKDGDSLMEDFVWTFTTGDKPDTTSPQVDANATTPKDDDNDVLRNIKLNIVFDKSIVPSTVNAQSIVLNDNKADSTVTGKLSFINSTTVVLSPDTVLDANTEHTLNLKDAITDLADNPLIAISLTFTTGANVSKSPQTVNLGTAGNYAILTKAGISTTGTTFIVGDIAVSPANVTALTGFNETQDASGDFATSTLVEGSLFAAEMSENTSSELTTAVSNMKSAYDDAADRVDPDFTELGAGEIGGLTLDPGLYKWGTGVLVTSDVTLNGSAEDVWIFQIAEGLKLEDGKSIILTGGARPENIFWQVAEEVTLQASTTFNGIILGKTGTSMGSGAVLNGRVLAQTAVTLIANDINQPSQ